MEVAEAESLRGYDVQLRCSSPFSLKLEVESSHHLRHQECVTNSELSIASGSNLEPVDIFVDDGADASCLPNVTVDHHDDVTSTATMTEALLCRSFGSSVGFNGDDKSTVTEVAESPSLVAASPGVKSTATNGQMSANFESTAAVKLQKVYRSYRTRRRLADSAVVAEELWWLAIDYVRLNHSTISFFNFEKPETAASRWNRVSLNASKVGKGLSKDGKAIKLAFQHWIEAIDPRHRYGHNLHLYYEEWCRTVADQPFFFWLDIGDGRSVDLKNCPRSKLRKQCIKYLGPQEREHYEYEVVHGKILHKQTGELLDTNTQQDAKWIFVMSTFKKLYAGEKKKGVFHHSSFLAGGATLAAGRLDARGGVLKSISAYSGHYRPTDENLGTFLNFLKENGVSLNDVQIRYSEDYENYDDVKSVEEHKDIRGPAADSEPASAKIETPANLKEDDEPDGQAEGEKTESSESEVAQTERNGSYQRSSSIGLQSPRAEVPKKAILQRINSKKAARSYQLGHQLSLKWSTGAGPRIGCVADYPMELRLQALEFVQLSPRTPPTPSSYRQLCSSPLSPQPLLHYPSM